MVQQPDRPADEASTELDNPDWVQRHIDAGDAARAVNRDAMTDMAVTGEFDHILAMIRGPIEIRLLVKIFDALAAEFPHAVLKQRGTFFVIYEHRQEPFDMSYGCTNC